jgi:CheY-like chemotaxis protein
VRLSNPVIKRPLQMFAIEGAATFLMVLMMPGDKGSSIITTPLIAGGIAAVCGLGIGLYEMQLIKKEYGAGGPVIAGAKLQTKKKEKRKEKAEEAPVPAPVAMRVQGAMPAGPMGSSVSLEQPATPAPAASVGAPRPTPRPEEPARIPQPSTQELAPAAAGDKLPSWMEKAMAQAKISQEGGALDSAQAGSEELTQEELRARLEQPVDMGMPIKATADQSGTAPAVDDIDSLVGAGSSAASDTGQIDSLLGMAPAGGPPSTAGPRSIQAAIIHTDPDQRRHISSMLTGIGLTVSIEADSAEDALLSLLDQNIDVIVTSLDVSSQPPADYIAKLRKASQFALIVEYGETAHEELREIAAKWPTGGPVPADLARMLGL